MLIIYGTRLKRYPVGYIPAWNPIHGKVEWVQLFEIRKQHHIFFSSTGPGKLLAYEARPLDNEAMPFLPELFHMNLLRESAEGDASHILINSDCEWRSDLVGLIEEEAKVHLPGAAVELRHSAILRRISGALYWADEGAQRSSHESLTAIIGVVMIFGAMASAVLLHSNSQWGWPTLIVALVALGLMLWRTTIGLNGSRWRVVRRELLNSLHAMNADSDEIRGAAAMVRSEPGMTSLLRRASRDIDAHIPLAK